VLTIAYTTILKYACIISVIPLHNTSTSDVWSRILPWGMPQNQMAVVGQG
jgi:hypothetical protein